MADEEFDSSSDEEVVTPATAGSPIGTASENVNNENREKELEVGSDAAESQESKSVEPAAEAGSSSNSEVNFKILKFNPILINLICSQILTRTNIIAGVTRQINGSSKKPPRKLSIIAGATLHLNGFPSATM